MSGSFDKKGSGQAKRPAPTIEGTATEVSVGSGDEEAETGEPATAGPATGAIETGASAPETEAPDGNETGAPPTQASYGARLLSGLTSLLTHALAGLIGGLAVLVAIATGYLPLGAFKEEADRFEARIAKLESAPPARDDTAALKGLDQRLSAVESKPAETPAELTALTERVAQLEASLKSMAEAAKDGGSVADAAAISRQIGEAEQRLDAKVKSEVQTALAEAKGGAAADARAIEGLKEDVAAIDAKLKALAEAKLGADDGAQFLPEITNLDERLGKIESMLPALVEAANEEATEIKKATLAIALANLRDAVNQGRPYTSELSTLAVLSPGALDLGSLLDYEETGIPTEAALAQSFEQLRDSISEAPAREDSIVGRLLGGAESLVKVKRVDEDAEGTSPDAVLARADAKLNKGDLAAAVKEVEMLEGPDAERFASWLDEAKARLDAPAALQRLQNVLLASLGGNHGKEATEQE